MAMSETMPPEPSDWAQFYLPPEQQPITNIFGGGRVSDATVVTTTVASPTAPHYLGQGRLSPEGRVSKPVRRRTRASRRNPTTVLNTDASNFRAMVQQFTGGPSLTQQTAQYPFLQSGSNLSYGFGLASNIHRHQQLANPTPATTGGYQFQFQPPQSGPFMFASPNNGLGISNADSHITSTNPEGLSFPGDSYRGSSSSSAGNETSNYMF